MKQNIIEFFNYLNTITKQYITAIELTPIRIQENMYISGFRKNGVGIIETHVQHIEHFIIKNSEFSMEVRRKTEPTAELWMNIELLNKDVINTTFNTLKNNLTQLTTFHILHMEYREKTDNNTDYITKEENIIFDNKQMACRTAIKKKNNTQTFKMKFIQFPTQNKNIIITDEEFAEMEI